LSEACEPLVSVIVVSYNTRAMTLECLRTVYAQLEGTAAEVIVVDNASTDGSADAVRQAFPAARLIASLRNLGFGAGNNLGFREARGKYFLLLNTDAFPRPGSIAALVEYLEAHAEAGVIGPRLLNKNETLQRSCFPFPTPGRAWLENLWLSALLSRHPVFGDYRKWPHDSDREVDWVIGACLLVRRKVYEQVGGFDERFFMYAEETDWQARIRQAGWKIAFTPAGEVVHLGGASGKDDAVKINRHFFDSLDMYERKHHGLPGLVALRAAMAVGCFLRFWLWLAAALSPRRRAVAVRKLKFHAWLTWRQMTLWHKDLKAAR
jgi:hypothetical protein